MQWKRPISTKELPRYNSRLARFAYRSFTYLGLTVVVVGSAVVLFFIYDASTYKSDPSVEDLNVSEVALNPRRGGPKNLPIAEHLIDDDDCERMRGIKHKPKLVILGTGWGSVAILKTLNPDEYHVTVVSPSNHFLFTPMLPSATVGTLEMRSLVEPVRRILHRIKGHFIKAMAEDVDFSEKLVECSSLGPNGEKQSFYLPYDKLIIGVGGSNPENMFVCSC
jgi:NADH dehydrogenase